MAQRTVFQFKISLKYIKPEIWRRVIVPGDYTFEDLHKVIVNVMGWSDEHMHKFSMRHPETGDEIEIGGVGEMGYDEDYMWLPESTKIAKYFITPSQKAVYEYDFGSPWYHNVVFEIAFPASEGHKYPVCLDGKRGTPPEEDPGSDYSESDLDMEDFNPELVTFDNCRDFLEDSTIEESEADISRPSKKIKSQTVSPSERKQVSLWSHDDESQDGNEMSDIIVGTKSRSEILNMVSSSLKRKMAKRESNSCDDDSDIDDEEQKRNNNEACLSKHEKHNNSEIPQVQCAPNRKSIMSQLEGEVEEDIEDAYGKYVASQMRLVTDLETREELRLEIQNCIKKFRFKKK